MQHIFCALYVFKYPERNCVNNTRVRLEKEPHRFFIPSLYAP